MGVVIPKKIGAILLIVVIVFTVISTLSILNIVYSTQVVDQKVKQQQSGEITFTIEKQKQTEKEGESTLSLNVLPNGG